MKQGLLIAIDRIHNITASSIRWDHEFNDVSGSLGGSEMEGHAFAILETRLMSALA